MVEPAQYRNGNDVARIAAGLPCSLVRDALGEPPYFRSQTVRRKLAEQVVLVA
jgi:hypothetical protein